MGTSTDQEGKEYFSDLGKHKKDFVWVNGEDDDAIELAFSKKKIEARKNWLRQFEVRKNCFPWSDCILVTFNTVVMLISFAFSDAAAWNLP